MNTPLQNAKTEGVGLQIARIYPCEIWMPAVEALNALGPAEAEESLHSGATPADDELVRGKIAARTTVSKTKCPHYESIIACSAADQDTESSDR